MRSDSSSGEQALSLDSSVHPASPLRELLGIAVPTILQMASYTIQQFTDILMLAHVSDLHAAASGSGGLVVFCFISFGFGVLMLVNALAGQAFGAKRFDECGRYLWQGVWVGVAYALLVLPSVFISRYAFEAFGHSEPLVRLETEYFAISMSFVVVKMVAVAFGQFMLAIDRPKIVLLSAAVGVAINILADYTLVFGKFGFPQMGIAGSAWGTNIGVTCELAILAAVTFGPKVRAVYNTLAWRFDRARFGELLRVGMPSGFQVTGDLIAWTIFLVGVMIGYGEAAFAANNYMMQYMKLSFMPAFGFGTAVTVLVARYVGAGKPTIARARAHLGFKITAVYMIACGLVFLTMTGPLMRLFTDDPEVIRIGRVLFVFCAIYQLFDAMFIVYVSALRGVKDTFWPAVVQIGLCWLLVVGGGVAVSRLRPEWGVGGPWTIGAVYGMILGLYLLYRFNAGHWNKAETLPEHGRPIAAEEPQLAEMAQI